MTPIIQASGIGKIYPGGTVANDGVNLTVMPGDTGVHAAAVCHAGWPNFRPWRRTERRARRMMPIAALTAVVVSVYAPWYVAVLAAVGSGALLGALMGFFHLRLKADVILVVFAVNILAAGGTVFALSLATGGDKGTSINLVSGSVPAIHPDFLQSIPVVGPTLQSLLSGHSVLTWLAFLSVWAIWYFLYRTPWGLWLRGVGEYAAAPAAAGIPIDKVRLWSLMVSGALAGAGARISRCSTTSALRAT
ncbi:MAG: hypothetical protein NTX73_09470 [Rhodobacterales bacterium]|nr:hypothetical protein [Rhodobacterales bacterium]